jgi:hypothetical protein
MERSNLYGGMKKKMGKINVAIVDDNERMVNLLEDILGGF